MNRSLKPKPVLAQIPRVALEDLPHRISHFVSNAAARAPEAVALVQPGGESWTYARFWQTIRATSGALHRFGVRPGDRVVIVCENGVEALALLFAASELDAWAVILNARQSAHEIDKVAAHCDPRALFFTDRDSAEAGAHAARHGATRLTLDGSLTVLASPVNSGAAPEPVATSGADQVAVLLYTTGTTGTPKGVMLTHRNLAFTTESGARDAWLSSGDTALGALPISHSYGLGVVLAMLWSGTLTYLQSRFSVAQAVDMIVDGRLTRLHVVPSMLGLILRHAKDSGVALSPNRLVGVMSAAAPLDREMKLEFEALTGVVMHNNYGLTETAPAISRTSHQSFGEGAHVGEPIEGVEIQVRTATGATAQPGETGELHVRGPKIMKGYYRAPGETAAVMDADGWLNTGDIVRVDEKNRIWIESRSKELIIRSGFNVYPPEVEAAINAHPDVQQSAVVGRAVAGNEEVVAFVEVRPGATISAADISAYVADRLAPYKRPQDIIIVSELPVAPNGKILKAKLADIAKRGAN